MDVTKSVLPLGGVAPLISEQESSSIWSALPGEADPALLRFRVFNFSRKKLECKCVAHTSKAKSAQTYIYQGI